MNVFSSNFNSLPIKEKTKERRKKTKEKLKQKKGRTKYNKNNKQKITIVVNSL
jgi:hypothetical protein